MQGNFFHWSFCKLHSENILEKSWECCSIPKKGGKSLRPSFHLIKDFYFKNCVFGPERTPDSTKHGPCARALWLSQECVFVLQN